MSLTSLGIATAGLLDGGSKPTLHLATAGLIRLGGAVQPPEVPANGGGGASTGSTFISYRLPKKMRRRLDAAKKLLADAPLAVVESLDPVAIDIDKLENIIKTAIDAANSAIDQREAGFMGDRVPERVTPLVEPFIRREDIERAPLLDVYDDMNLRLLLLLGV